MAALLALQRAGVAMTILDARTGAKEMIPGAVEVPAGLSDAEVEAKLPAKTALYITYCGGPQCDASAQLAARLAGLGYSRVVEFRDGWAGWSEHRAGKKLARPEVSPAALKVLMAAGTDLRILDARTGKFDDGQRIPGARSLHARSEAGEVERVLPRKDQLVFTYCSNLKCPASEMLAGRLEELGYGNVIEMPHGIDGWAGSGYEVEKKSGG
jgi:rhodanese-related sulfurtransferase